MLSVGNLIPLAVVAGGKEKRGKVSRARFTRGIALCGGSSRWRHPGDRNARGGREGVTGKRICMAAPPRRKSLKLRLKLREGELDSGRGRREAAGWPRMHGRAEEAEEEGDYKTARGCWLAR